jgi:hypothetical protein
MSPHPDSIIKKRVKTWHLIRIKPPYGLKAPTYEPIKNTAKGSKTIMPLSTVPIEGVMFSGGFSSDLRGMGAFMALPRYFGARLTLLSLAKSHQKASSY